LIQQTAAAICAESMRHGEIGATREGRNLGRLPGDGGGGKRNSHARSGRRKTGGQGHATRRRIEVAVEIILRNGTI